MSIDYVIVQAGGKGTRLEGLTRNKPKALVPIDNLPMIFHLFRKFPDKKFLVIGDYKCDVLKRYLEAFATVDFSVVCATGSKGTCGGLREALSHIPPKSPFLLIWCDLVLPKDYELPDVAKGNWIGVSKDFPCRWSYKDGSFEEVSSTDQGVAGHFVFQDKDLLSDVPDEGEFVRYLQGKGIYFLEQGLYRTHEYGLKSEWEKIPKAKCRPFNKIEFDGDRLIKIAIDKQGEDLAVKEKNWYRVLFEKNFPYLPKIYSFDPFTMERIDGMNLYECKDLTFEEKSKILVEVVDALKSIHAQGHCPTDVDSYYDAYVGKTFKRLEKVIDLVPFAHDEFIIINGKKCRNVFFHKEEIKEAVMSYLPAEFAFLHGDCTFSNIMLRKDGTPVFIDPRGYFGHTEIYGDPAYDWVKLFYSLYSNYDQFNLKRFDLRINEDSVDLSIESNGWEDLSKLFFSLLEDEVTERQITLFLAITWLSLTTYAWEDYDSICGAFYNGLYYLEDAFHE